MDPGPKFVQHYFQNIQNKFLSYLLEKQFFVWINNSILLNCRFIMYRELKKWIGSHRIRIFPPDIRKNTCKHRALHWTIWIKGWIAPGWLKEKDESYSSISSYAKWLVRQGIDYILPSKQKQRPLPFLLSLSFFYTDK